MGEFVGCAGTFAADMDSPQAPGRDYLAPYSSIVDGSPRAGGLTAESCSFYPWWRALDSGTQTVGAGGLAPPWGGGGRGRRAGSGFSLPQSWKEGLLEPTKYSCQPTNAFHS